MNLLHLMTDCNSRQRYKSVSVTSSTTNLWVSQQVLLLCNQILLFLFPRSLLKPSPLRSPFPQTEQQRLFPDAHSPIRTSSNEQHGPESEKGKETTGKTVTHQREASGGSGRAHDEGGPAPGAERALRPEIHLHCRRQNLPPQPSLTLPDPPSLSLVQEKKRPSPPPPPPLSLSHSVFYYSSLHVFASECAAGLPRRSARHSPTR